MNKYRLVFKNGTERIFEEPISCSLGEMCGALNTSTKKEWLFILINDDLCVKVNEILLIEKVEEQ